MSISTLDFILSGYCLNIHTSSGVIPVMRRKSYIMYILCTSQQTLDVVPMLLWCWASVADGGLTSNQHWLNVSCCWVVSEKKLLKPTYESWQTWNGGCLRHWINIRATLVVCVVFGSHIQFCVIVRNDAFTDRLAHRVCYYGLPVS